MTIKDIHITYDKKKLTNIYKRLCDMFHTSWKNNNINPEYEYELFNCGKINTIKMVNNKSFYLLEFENNSKNPVGYYFEQNKFDIYIKEFLFNIEDYSHLYEFPAPSARIIWEQTSKNNLYLFVAAVQADMQYIYYEVAEDLILGFIQFLRQLASTNNLNLIPL